MMTCRQPVSSLNSPFPTSLSTSAISSSATAASILSGTTWRRNLARLSKKWKPNTKQSYPVSGTVAAAATEKLIRRPQTTIQTEDLTASQFAHMAGIKIKRGRNHQDMEQSIIEQQLMYDDDDDDDTSDDDTEDDDDSDANGMPSLSLDHQQIRQLTTRSIKAHHHGSIPCMTSYSTARYHPIWDVRFWQKQQQEQEQQEQQSGGMNDKRPGQKDQDNSNNSKTVVISTSPVGSMLSSSSGQYSDLSTNGSLSATDTCLSNTLSSTSLSSASSSTSSATTKKQPRVFHKGRFRIVLGDDGNDDDTTNNTTTDGGDSLVRTISYESSNNVVEWYRKRTMSQ